MGLVIELQLSSNVLLDVALVPFTTYCLTDPWNSRTKKDLHMFLVRACLGRMYKTDECKRRKRPPCRERDCGNDECAHEDRYHSIVEERKFIFREFIVYEGCQAYPEYLITYDRE